MLLAGLLQSAFCVLESGVRKRVSTDAKWTAILMEQSIQVQRGICCDNLQPLGHQTHMTTCLVCVLQLVNGGCIL